MRNIGITGGAGFIGTNTALHFLSLGDRVTVFDNLTRPGTGNNLLEIQKLYPDVIFQLGDIRDPAAVAAFVASQDVIIHLAAQVAVTTSVVDPMNDFSINALGTMTLLDEIRKSRRQPIVIYSSTNKVYGSLTTVPVIETDTRYAFVDRKAVDESVSLDFHSPYGCSKGAADQYIRDFYRVYGVPTVVFRQSCIYGPHQFGVEDQGWVAWFLIASMLDKPMTIYGNGKQVRDLLYVEDLVSAYETAIENIEAIKGDVFNMGGGPGNTLSVWTEFRPILASLIGHDLAVKFGPVRQGDQPIFIADTGKFEKATKWKAKIGLQEGIGRMHEFLKSRQDRLLTAFR